MSSRAEERLAYVPAVVAVTLISPDLYDVVVASNDKIGYYGYGLDIVQVMQQLEAMPNAVGSFAVVWAPQNVREAAVACKLPNTHFRPREELMRKFGTLAPEIESAVLEAAVPWTYRAQVCGPRARPEVRDWLLPVLLQRARELEAGTNIFVAVTERPGFLAAIAIEMLPFVSRQIIEVYCDQAEWLGNLSHLKGRSLSVYFLGKRDFGDDAEKRWAELPTATLTLSDWAMDPMTKYSCVMPPSVSILASRLPDFAEAQTAIFKLAVPEKAPFPWIKAPVAEITRSPNEPRAKGSGADGLPRPETYAVSRRRATSPPTESSSLSMHGSDGGEEISMSVEEEGDDESSDVYDDDEEDDELISDEDDDEEAESHSVHSDDLTGDESEEAPEVKKPPAKKLLAKKPPANKPPAKKPPAKAPVAKRAPIPVPVSAFAAKRKQPASAASAVARPPPCKKKLFAAEQEEDKAEKGEEETPAEQAKITDTPVVIDDSEDSGPDESD